MKSKIVRWSGVLGATVAAFGLAAITNASVMFTVPTSTASSLTANVGDQISDPGTLLVIGVAVGIPLAFYVIHELIGLLPGRRSRRS